MLIKKPSNLCWQFFFKKTLHILEDTASSVQVESVKITTYYLILGEPYCSHGVAKVDFKGFMANSA